MRIVAFVVFMLVSLLGQTQSITGSSWAEVKRTGKGVFVIYWFESRPFIYRNSLGQLDGLEYEIANDFVAYVRETYQVELTSVWKEAKSFDNIFEITADSQEKGFMGCSAISMTDERRQRVAFTPSYMANVCVMISNKDLPVFASEQEFATIASDLTAITIAGTTYDADLINIRKDFQLSYRIQYIASSDNVLNAIRDKTKTFGFIDLPMYLMDLNRNAGNTVKRQNIFSKKREGYSYVYPKSSDWQGLLNDYFKSDRFKNKREEALSKYFENDIYEFIERLMSAEVDELTLLNKEKEIQEATLTGKNEQLQQQGEVRNFLIAIIGLSITLVVSLFLLYTKTNKINQQLNDQKSKIEGQGRSIENQNKQLEQKATRLHLINEEKNNLIKILAHDLRSPINQVQGLAQIFLLQNKTLPSDQLDLIHKITDSATRLNSMIGKILDVDAIESNRANLILENINVIALIRQIVASFEQQAKSKNIQIQFNTTLDRLSFEGDSLFFTEILENLISNGLKFSNRETRIDISVTDGSTTFSIAVKDQGPGLLESDFPKLFQKYQRLSARPTDGENSTGLGLSIVKKYSDLMGGKVFVTSTPGEGTTFTLEFPKRNSVAQ